MITTHTTACSTIGFVQAGIFIDAICNGKQIRLGKWVELQYWTSAQWKAALERVAQEAQA